MKILQANATLYPDQILIATVDKTDRSSITTSTITKLPVDASADSIGQTIRKHLFLSKNDVPANTDFLSSHQDFLKAAGFKNAKAHHKGARFLSLYQKNEEIVITPTKNEKRSFVGTKDLPSIHVNVSASDQELGEQIRGAWLKCIDNSV